LDFTVIIFPAVLLRFLQTFRKPGNKIRSRSLINSRAIILPFVELQRLGTDWGLANNWKEKHYLKKEMRECEAQEKKMDR
jgi:hypothetical protein